ncbi:MAG: hypothetical protein R3F39_21560 [Myxococcota bacterium]
MSEVGRVWRSCDSSAIVWRIGAMAAGLALALTACGGGVRMLATDDQRLPLEARRWVADAEDGVLVARAFRDRAAQRRADVLTRSRSLADEADTLAGSGGGDAAERLRQVADARVALANAELRLAEAELAMSETRRAQINAETAVQHDLAVYDLAPLKGATEAALAQIRRQRSELDRQRAELEQLTSAWWESYARFTAQSGRRDLLWR